MLGSTRRSGYPSDSSRSRRSQQLGDYRHSYAGDPLNSSDRAWDWPCRPARTVPPMGDSD